MKSSILRKITRRFNKFRNPECKATTIRNSEVELEVEFTGTTSGFACCFDEHFIDYKYMLKDNFKMDFIIDGIKRISDDKFIVRYKYKKEV